MKYAGWLLDAGSEYERAISGPGYAPSMGGMTAEPLVLRSDAVAEIDRLRAALVPLANAHFSCERDQITAADCERAWLALYGPNRLLPATEVK